MLAPRKCKSRGQSLSRGQACLPGRLRSLPVAGISFLPQGTVAALGATTSALPAFGSSASPANPSGASAAADAAPQAKPVSKRKIPIGVFDPVFEQMELDPMLDLISGWGIEAVEMGTGGFPGNRRCPLDELLQDPAKAKAWKRKFESKNIQVATLSCHGNPVHPDAKIAARDALTFRKTVQLAERLEVPVIVGFSGCPGGAPGDTMPNWATVPMASGVRPDPELAVEREGGSVLERCSEVCARARHSQTCFRDASGLCGL